MSNDHRADFNCPYCRKISKLEPESLPWNDEEEIEYECWNCDKIFVIKAVLEITHYCEEKDE